MPLARTPANILNQPNLKIICKDIKSVWESVPDLARTEFILLVTISWRFFPLMYVGSALCHLGIETLGLIVDMLHILDAMSRKQHNVKLR